MIDNLRYACGPHFEHAITDRLAHFFMEKYIHTPQNVQLWWLLEDIMLQVNPESVKSKVMGSLVTAPPHAGKTTGVRQFRKAYLENVPGAKPTDIILFRIPSRAHLKGVLAKLGRQLHIPDIPENPGKTYPTYLIGEKIAGKLRIDGTKLVIIDEFQKLFELSSESRIEILSGFNDLLNESFVPFILVGVAGVDKILDLEPSMDESNLKGTFCSRFPEFRLRPWDDPFDENFGAFLRTIYEDCDLRPPPGSQPFYVEDNVRERIIELTGGLTGKIIQLIKWCARNLIRNHQPEIITPEALNTAFSEIQAIGW